MLSWLQRRLDARAAGSSARAEYERLKREWHRRMRKRFIVLGLVFGGITIASWILAAVWPRLTFTSGIITGALLAMFIALRESPPSWVEQWLTGSQGEQWTDKELRKLEPRGWRVLRDMKRRGINFDHVVVGPAGVFVIDSKNLDGSVTCARDTMTLHRPGAAQDGRPAYTTDSLARGVRFQAADLNDLLRRRLGEGIWVSGVVTIWAEFEQGSVRGDRMDYVRGDMLVTWLQSQDVRLNEAKVAAIERALSPGRRRRRS